MDELKRFQQFYEDADAWDMYITGQAGTGKTTLINEFVEYCNQANINYLVCAYTHKACRVLENYLPANAKIKTLHSFLRKRPTINTEATKEQAIEQSRQFEDPEEMTLLFIDEFSMVGESDYVDIRALQDPDYNGKVNIKVVWFGDPNQLPPVKTAPSVFPEGDYWLKLTKIHRQAEDNPLIKTLTTLAGMIEGGARESLKSHKTFQRDQPNLAELYINSKETDKVFLAYTNRVVQAINRQVEGKSSPDPGDRMFCNTSHKYYTLLRKIPKPEISYIDRIWDDPLMFNSKYKTLEFLLTMEGIEFYLVSDDDEIEYIFPVIFGNFDYKIVKEQLGQNAAASNREIPGANAAMWAKENYKHPLARQRAFAWRSYLTFKDTVLNMDFTHAMTIHKSQGSTFKEVYLDAEDLYQCAEKNYDLYLRLYYVAISRASRAVYTS